MKSYHNLAMSNSSTTSINSNVSGELKDLDDQAILLNLVTEFAKIESGPKILGN